MAKPRVTRIFRPTPTNLRRLANALQRGQLVAVPSETVYGLAANALNPVACAAIFEAKGRPTSDPLIVHIASLRQLFGIAKVNTDALCLAKAFWPGPLTLVLPRLNVVPDIVTAGRDSVAVRLPANRWFRQLIRQSGLPLAAPSANPFGYVSPTTAGHVFDGLKGRIDSILDGGPASIGLESTIVDLRRPGHPVILRPGSISSEAIAAKLKVVVQSHRHKSTPKDGGMISPGLLLKHYSPKTPVVLHRKLTAPKVASQEAYLFQSRPHGFFGSNVFWLSETDDDSKAAHQLFAKLRHLDNGEWTCIHAEMPAEKAGISLAIRDRLIRAATKR